jgi:membrane-bound metal-dependent hydrolase YbcI (DUF457 family)
MVNEKIAQIHNSMIKVNDDYITLWKEEMFLTWRWWLVILLTILPWLFWFLIRKKESTNRLLLSGLFVYVITSALDSVGIAFGLWSYLYTPFPYLHTFFMPWDLTLFPVLVMLLIQYKPRINPYIKAVLFSLFTAFVFEPFFTWINIYVPFKWKHYYGVPIYIFIYIIANGVSRRSNFEPVN